jgi:LacI family transcriptional regulator
MRYMEGLSAEADATKVLLSLHSVKQDDRGRLSDPHVAPAMITENVCDVVIVWGPHDSSDIAYIVQRAPVVSLNWPYVDLNVDLVATDDVDGIRRIVDRLAMLGHRRMAFVYYSTPTYYDSRRAGFIDGCVRHELPLTEQMFIQPTATWAPEPFITAVEQGVTAFVCVSDRVVEKIAPILKAAGVRIPEDVSLTGFNADDHALIDGKSITSIDPQFVEMGRAALRLALQRYNQPAASVVTVRPVGRLVEGQTTAPPRRVAFQMRPIG